MTDPIAADATAAAPATPATPATPSVPATPATPAAQAGALRLSRAVTLAAFAALAVLSMAWEFWLAPLRPGGSLLALKAVPLVLAIPALRAGRLRAYQAWSMAILIYLCEGLVRATSDAPPSAWLAILEAVLALAAFGAILVYTRARRLAAGPAH